MSDENRGMCSGCDSVEVDNVWTELCETCENKNWCDKCEVEIVENEGDLCSTCQAITKYEERHEKHKIKNPTKGPKPDPLSKDPQSEEPPIRDVPRWGNGY